MALVENAMLMRHGRRVLAMLVWAVICLGLPALAETLNGAKPGGTPLGLLMVALAAPLLLAIAAAILARRGEIPPTSVHEGRTP